MADENKENNSQDKKDNKNLFNNLTGGSGNSKKPKFNFYWIYGLLAVIFIGIQFMNWGGGAALPD